MNGMRLVGARRGPLHCFSLTSRAWSTTLLRCRRLGRPCPPAPPSLCGRKGPLRVFAALGDGWTPHGDPGPLLEAIYKRVQPVADALVRALQAMWQAQQQWAQRAWAKTMLATVVALGLATAVVNAWGVPAINRRLPDLVQQAVVATQRDISVGGVQWIAPTGITGLHPLVSVGPISVGAGPTERSSATLGRVAVGVDMLQSILRGRIVVTATAVDAEVHLKQGDGFSWFGYPDDTTPSSRELFPGLGGGSGSSSGTTASSSQSRSNKRGGGGGSSSGGGGVGGPEQRQQQRLTQRSGGSSSSARAEFSAATESPAGSFLQRVADELLHWHADQERAARAALLRQGSSTDAGEPTLLLLSTTSGGSAKPEQTAATPGLDTFAVAQQQPSSSSGQLAPSSPPAAPGAASEDGDGAPGQRRGPWHRLLPSFLIGNKEVAGGEGSSSSSSSAQQSEVLEQQQQAVAIEREARESRRQKLEAINSMQITMRGLEVKKDSRSKVESVPAAAAATATSATTADTQATALSEISATTSFADAALKSEAASLPFQLDFQEISPGTATNLNLATTSGEETEANTSSSDSEFAASAAVSSVVVVPSARGAALLNALPPLEIDIRSKAPPPAAGVQESAATPAAAEAEERLRKPLSQQALQINSLQPLSREGAPPLRQPVVATSEFREFSQAVVDQATLRKKGLGSKALQQARNWQPAKPPVVSDRPAALPSTHAAAAERPFGSFTFEDSTTSGTTAGDAASAAPRAASLHSEDHAGVEKSHNGKYHITHPGYFTPSAGPVYTPAPPEALAELRAKQRTLGTLMREAFAAAGALVQRSLVLGSVDLTGGTLYGYIQGESLPRIFDNVSGNVHLGPGYDSLRIDLNAFPRQRAAASSKCTMPNPEAHRHLRHVTGQAALRVLEEQVQAATLPVESSQQAQQFGPGSGGRVRVLVEATGVVDNDLATEALHPPDMTITIQGENLHAPLVERIVELPMDIDEGRANGDFVVRMHTRETWQFPEFYGKVAVRGASFHFWDATDDVLDADLDLLFEKDRVYLHNARGSFGAVGMTLTGDLDLNPQTGNYRLSATVPKVEANELRATLGVRPTPFPVAGAVSGTLHITGPLEKPVFSGHAIVVRPDDAMLADCEPTNAVDTLLAEPAAVAAYDKVPIARADLVFSLDTSAEELTLHSFSGSPVGGGDLHGSGTMGVSPASEFDPKAVLITAQGVGLPAEALAQRYLPDDAQLPPGMISGPAAVSFTMKGAHLAPIIDVAFSLPEASATGSARFLRDSTALSISSPDLDASGAVFLRPPTYEAVKAALTQTQATALAKPDVSGCDADVTLRGLDVVPLVSDEAARRQLAQQSGEPLRLRVNGRVKVSGTVAKSEPSLAVEVERLEEGSAAENGAGAAAAAQPWEFAGSVDLEDLKLNQLKLYQSLKGNLKLSESHVAVHAKGSRPDESLDVDLSLPLLPDDNNAATDGEHPSGSSVSVRCGKLHAAATVDGAGSQLDVKVANVKLDELELASLRGELQEISCSLNFGAQTGRGRLGLVAPRYSGLSGDSLSGGFRWERDVVRLEKLVLQQSRSKYEVQGEYVVPPSMPLPTSAADLARRQQQQHQEGASNQGKEQQVPGRWRVRVDVPTADMQEILPGARLLQSAASRAPADYERAKAAFMSTVRQISLKAEDLNSQVRAMAEKLAREEGLAAAAGSAERRGSDGAAAAAPHHLQMPALQDVHGSWSGSVQAFGGGGGATSCDFDVKGVDWQWGQAKLDSVGAHGSFHSEEGIQLQDFSIKLGSAQLSLHGSLLGDNQDATFVVNDFPVAKLRPLFRAVPALKNTTPAVSARAPEPIGSPLPLGMLANALSRASQDVQVNAAGLDADSPINGLLYINGKLRGSKDAPSGEVKVELCDAAVGPTRLSKAEAMATLSDKARVTFNIDVVPVEGHRTSGFIKASGGIPLAALRGDNAAATATSESGSLNVQFNVKDSGMAVLTSMAPDFRWQSGEADVSFNATGSLEQPTVTGNARLNKAIIDCPLLKYPLNIVAADIRCKEGVVDVETVDVRVGRKGHVRARGVLPVYQSKQVQRGVAPALAAMQQRLTVDVQGLELRVRNIYTGQLDALLTLRDSVERPVVGGSLRFSRGSVFLIPQGQDMAGAGPGGAPAPAATSVAKLFDLLTRRESGLAARLEDAVRQEAEAVEQIVQEAAGTNLMLDSLALQFGPDLRAVYPLMMNFGVAGELVTSGQADPKAMSVAGVLKLPGGDVNLLAAQLELDREHANTLTFGGMGVDPLVDLVMKSGELRVTVQGRASEWADHLTMQIVGGVNSSGGDAAEQLDAAEAARLLETKLKTALLADDGQLALSRLAGTTVSTLLPKLDAQGTVGGTRWRLVSAPAIPGLLDPLLSSDPSNLLGSITMGTEVEVQFGRKLQATMVRKLQDSTVHTKWALNYLLNSKLRMQFNISSASPYSKTLMFQFSSEGSD